MNQKIILLLIFQDPDIIVRKVIEEVITKIVTKTDSHSLTKRKSSDDVISVSEASPPKKQKLLEGELLNKLQFQLDTF